MALLQYEEGGRPPDKAVAMTARVSVSLETGRGFRVREGRQAVGVGRTATVGCSGDGVRRSRWGVGGTWGSRPARGKGGAAAESPIRRSWEARGWVASRP